jgi:hypothetical protein
MGTNQIQDNTTLNVSVEGVHHLVDGGVPIPPVEVEDVDVVSTEILETPLDGRLQSLGAVTGVRSSFDRVRLAKSV